VSLRNAHVVGSQHAGQIVRTHEALMGSWLWYVGVAGTLESKAAQGLHHRGRNGHS
jgi:hypothetical protein